MAGVAGESGIVTTCAESGDGDTSCPCTEAPAARSERVNSPFLGPRRRDIGGATDLRWWRSCRVAEEDEVSGAVGRRTREMGQ